MAKITALHPVVDGELATSRPVKSLAEAVEGGNYLEILRAQRREIALSLPDEKGPAKAALHRQLSLIAKEIELLESKRDREEADEDGVVGDESWSEEAI